MNSAPPNAFARTVPRSNAANRSHMAAEVAVGVEVVAVAVVAVEEEVAAGVVAVEDAVGEAAEDSYSSLVRMRFECVRTLM
jgi:hypothetical protein